MRIITGAALAAAGFMQTLSGLGVQPADLDPKKVAFFTGMFLLIAGLTFVANVRNS